ncbi:hypothetical protein EJ08DRAFT_645274 [Tothia fuscella]|uniref:Uncharacterized protein n=1 Tax=Tothia fuscella TaxID=1048955 RepID=A0A9P4P2X1_9PEZI|nr:hypothetical protein EJ08DRAFT_645274 [Tothia fuscella]
MKGLLVFAFVYLAAAQGFRGERPGERDCSCPASNPPVCKTGTLCECDNEAKVACWASHGGNCAVGLKVCPASPTTGQNTEFPACGQNLPACAAGKTCRKLDNFCDDSNRGATCLGLCIDPPVKAPKAPKTPAAPKSPALPPVKSPAVPKSQAPALPWPSIPTAVPVVPGTVPVGEPKAPKAPGPVKGPYPPKGPLPPTKGNLATNLTVAAIER